MRILQVARRYVVDEWGGTETVIAKTSKELLGRGHHTELWTSSALSHPGEEIINGLEVSRFDYIYPFLGLNALDKERLDKKGGNLFSFPMMRKLMKKRNFDIYHLHTGKRLGAEAAFLARLQFKPYVMTLHGGVAEIPDLERKDMLSPIKGKVEWGKAIGAMLGSRSLIKNASAILCVNPAEVDVFKEAYPDKLVEHLPNGVDFSDYENPDGHRFRQKYGFKDDEQLIVCISRIDHQKNQLGLVEAFAKLKDSNKNARLILIGPQTNLGYAIEVKELADNLGVGDRLSILKPLVHASRELADAFVAADVFVLPSIHEPFGIVILEAWCAGKPVVASNVGGVPYLVEHGKDGLLVKSGDEEALANSIKQVLEDENMARSLGENGYKKVHEKYSWDTIVSRMIGIYETLVKDK